MTLKIRKYFGVILLLFILFNDIVIASDCDVLTKAINSLNSFSLNSDFEKVGDCCQFNGVTCNGEKQIIEL